MPATPTISGTFVSTLNEGAAATYSRSGTVRFSDTDVGSVLAVQFGTPSLLFKSSAGVEQTSLLSSERVASLLSGLSVVANTTYSSGGTASWTYSIADSSLDFLGSAETVTIVMPVKVTDETGLTSTQNVVVTLRGTNDIPVITAATDADVSASITELTGQLASAVTVTRQGAFTLSDFDLTDTHTVSISPKAGGYLGTMTATLQDTSNGQPGNIAWTYSAQDKVLDVLGAGQVQTQIYTVSVTDKKGGTVTKDVVVTLTGTNDAPTVTGTTSVSYSENTSSAYNVSGTLNIADADGIDRPVLSVLGRELVYKDATGVDVTSQLSSAVSDALRNAFTLPTGVMTSNKLTTAWNYSISDSAIDFLGRNEVITIKSTVQVDDQRGGVITKDVVITLRGTNDAVVFTNAAPNSLALSASVTEVDGVTAGASSGSATGTLSFTDLDANDKHVVSVVNLATGYIGKFTTTMIDGAGSTPGALNWNYTVGDKALDYLAAGETLTQVYRVTLSDSKGSAAIQDVTITSVGTDDKIVVSGSDHATYYEPLDSAHQSTPSTLSGVVTINDADASDKITVSLGSITVSVFDENGVDISTLPAGSLSDHQASMLSQAQSLAQYFSIGSSASNNSGSINWSYSADPSTLKFLDGGYSVRVSANVDVNSAHGNGTSETIVKPIVVDLHAVDETFQSKDHVDDVVHQAYLENLPDGVGIGNPHQASELVNYKSLGAADGVFVRSTMGLQIVKDGAVFDGVDFRGMQIEVSANNVTFVNCLFGAASNISFSIRSSVGTTGLTIDHSTFDGGKIDAPYQAFIISQGADAKITNNVFMDAPCDAVSIVGGVVSGNYFKGAGYYSLAHADAIWVGKTVSPVVIDNNVIDWRNPIDIGTGAGTNNAIRISSELGDIDNVSVTNNVLLGGNYTITVTDGPTWTNTIEEMGKLTNVAITGNIIDLGRTGEYDLQHPPEDTIYTGNEALWGTGTPFGSESTGAALDFADLTTVVGSTRNDQIIGLSDHEYIVGGAGSDYLHGGDGNDIILGGMGRDFLYGGAGADIFLAGSVRDGTDLIADFEQGVDKVDLSLLAPLLSASDWKWAGFGHFTGTPFQIRYVQLGNGTTSVYVDVDGNMTVDYRVDFTGNYTFKMDDFIVSRTGSKPVDTVVFSDADVNTYTSTANFSFSFASAPIEVVNGVVVMRHADGTLVPLGGLNSVSFSDGTILNADGNPVVDDLFYYTKYKSVWADGIDADADFNSTGWQQGRDPNAFFSTKGYIAAHDLDGTVNPYDYYHDHGWKLGDDPNVNFDTALYLLRYKDVAASGMDPLQHYLTIGREQGRAISAAIGDVIVDGFDAEYYLLGNPSVASSDLSPLEHYMTIGWKLGLKPNAFFDPQYYISHNPDVALSGVEPLTHFMNVGWLAGRDPSRSFDVSSYLLANPDVVLSGMNPLTHYLTLGVYEGRRTFASGIDYTGTAPVALADTVQLDSAVGAGVNGANVLANDSDLQSNPLTVIAVNGSMGNVGTEIQGTFGKLTLNSDGTYSYVVTSTDGSAGVHATDTFRYVVSDGTGGYNSATLQIVLNRAATANADDRTVDHGAAGTPLIVDAASGVLANDLDADGDTLQVVAVGGTADGVGTIVAGQYGDLQLNADGSYTYILNGTAPREGGVTDTFTYSISDGHGSTQTASLVLNIAGAVNVAPTIVADDRTVDHGAAGTPLIVDAAAGVLANDLDADGDTLQVVAVGGEADGVGTIVSGQYGDLQLNADGSYTYILNGTAPREGGVTDTFTYSISDGHGSTQTASLVLNIAGAVNVAPTIVADDRTVDHGAAGTPLIVDAASGVLANDLDADGDTLQVVAVGGTADGVGTIVAGQYGDLQLNADGSYTYILNGTAPREGGVTDTFTYSISDGHGSTQTASLVLNIAGAVNVAPTIVADDRTVDHGAAGTPLIVDAASGVLANDLDADGDTLQVVAVGGTADGVGTIVAGQYGDLQLNADGSYTYILNGTAPREGGVTDTFTYSISDGHGSTQTASLVLNIAGAVNVAPTIVADDRTVDHGAAGTPLIVDAAAGVLANDLDADGDTLQVVAVGGEADGVGTIVSGQYGDLQLNADGSYTYILNGTAPREGGVTDTFTYSISDGHGSTQTASLVLNIAGAVNVAPTIVADDRTVDHGAAGTPLIVDAASGVLANDLDADGDTLQVVAVGGTADGVGTVVAGQYGDLQLNADGSYTYILNGTAPREGGVTDTFTYSISDGHGSTQTASLVLNIAGAVNVAPTIVADDRTVDHGAAGTPLIVDAASGVLANDLDADGDTLQVVAVGGTADGVGTIVAGQYGDLQLNADGSYTYILNGTAPREGGVTDTFTYSISDGHGSTQTASLVLNIAGAVNVAPTIVADDRTVDHGAAGTPLIVDAAAGVLANDLDADGDTLQVVAVGGEADGVGTIVSGQYGDLQLNADGSYTYILNGTAPREGGVTDTFTYSISDGHGSTQTASLVLNIAGAVNVAPTIVADDRTVDHGAAGTPLIVDAASGVLANDLDADGDTLQVVAVGGEADGVGTIVAGQYGDLQLNADGSYTYILNGTAPREGGVTDTFTYSISDGHGSTQTASLVLNIAGSGNVAPTLVGGTTVSLTEGSLANYALHGALTFADADVGESLVLSVASQSVSIMSASGVDITSGFSAAQLDALKAAFALSTGAVGQAGVRDWSYDIADSAIDFLAENETVSIVTRVKVTDTYGETAWQDVIVKIVGTNDKPAFDTNVTASFAASAPIAITEIASQTGAMTTQTQVNSFSFYDPDFTDSHSVTVTMKGSGYLGTLVANVVAEPSGSSSGILQTTFSVPDKRLDQLGADQTITQVYTLTLTDDKGSIIKRDVSIVLVGSDDLPTITGTTKASLVEGSAPSQVRTGALTFSDVDLIDKLVTSIGAQTVELKSAAGLDITSLLSETQLSSLKSAFSMPVGDLGKNSGTATWSYTISDANLDFIGQNDMLTVNTIVKVDDGKGGIASQVISVSVRGINDAPTVKAYANNDPAITATVNEASLTYNHATLVDRASGSFAFQDADLSDTHTVSVKAAGSGYYGTLTASVATDSTGGREGSIAWQFSVNDKALDFLAAGQTLTQTYGITVSDGKSGTIKQDVTVVLVGAADQFIFNSPGANVQTIAGFTPGSDKLLLSASAFGNYHTGTLDDAHFVTGAAATDASAQFVYNSTTGKLYFDADGNHSGAAVLVAQLTGNPALHASDILLF